MIVQVNAQIMLDEQGNVRVSRPARDVGRDARAMGGLPSLIEEEVRERVADGIHYAGWLLNRIDPTNRLYRVGLACRLAGIGYLPWRTRAEAAESPNSASMGSGEEAADRCRFVFADAGFAGRLVDWAGRVLRTTVHIVRKPAGQKGFSVLPRRWAVERTLAWLTNHRRLARDYERDPATSEAMIRWAAINTMVRRLARDGPASRPEPRPLE